MSTFSNSIKLAFVIANQSKKLSTMEVIALQVLYTVPIIAFTYLLAFGLEKWLCLLSAEYNHIEAVYNHNKISFLNTQGKWNTNTVIGVFSVGPLIAALLGGITAKFSGLYIRTTGIAKIFFFWLNIMLFFRMLGGLISGAWHREGVYHFLSWLGSGPVFATFAAVIGLILIGSTSYFMAPLAIATSLSVRQVDKPVRRAAFMILTNGISLVGAIFLLKLFFYPYGIAAYEATILWSIFLFLIPVAYWQQKLKRFKISRSSPLSPANWGLVLFFFAIMIAIRYIWIL